MTLPHDWCRIVDRPGSTRCMQREPLDGTYQTSGIAFGLCSRQTIGSRAEHVVESAEFVRDFGAD